MPEIVKTFEQSLKAMRFIGKKYGENDRENGSFGAKWEEWLASGWFELIEAQSDRSLSDTYEDGDASVGLMRVSDGEFEYWIGYFTPENTPVPDGFSFVDFTESKLGTCWLYGNEAELYGHGVECQQQLAEKGYKPIGIDEGGWCFERYAHQRFITPDEQGNVTLDICFFLK